MAEQILDANLSTVVRYRKIVQFSREMDVLCDANWLTPLTALAKLKAVAYQAADDTVDDLIDAELASQSTVLDTVPTIAVIDAQVGVALAFDFTASLVEGATMVSHTHVGGTLPSGVTHDATLFTLSGTPAAATQGTYTLEFASVVELAGVQTQGIDTFNLVVAPAA